jgi:hypothetical protein
MTRSKNIKFEYDQTDELKSLIERVYFSEENDGKLPNSPKGHLTLQKDNLYYLVLTGLNYSIRLRNNKIIDGSMNFDMVENNDTIELIPSSKYCVKISEDDEKYSFW